MLLIRIWCPQDCIFRESELVTIKYNQVLYTLLIHRYGEGPLTVISKKIITLTFTITIPILRYAVASHATFGRFISNGSPCTLQFSRVLCSDDTVHSLRNKEA